MEFTVFSTGHLKRPRLLKRSWHGARNQMARWFASWFAPQPLFVFGGRSGLWPGLGRELYAQDSTFRATVQKCDSLLQKWGETSVLPCFESSPAQPDFPSESARVHFTGVLQLSLAELWRACGVQPAATLGMGLGEIAAVYAAGGLELEAALRIATVWGQASRLQPAVCRLLSVATGSARANELAVNCPAPLFLVAVLAERCLLLCAEEDTLAASAYLELRKVAFQILKTSWPTPYHTGQLTRHEKTLAEPLRGMLLQPLALPCFLAALGRVAPRGTVLGPGYWLNALRFPIQLHAVQQAVEREGNFFGVPIGPDPFWDMGESLAPLVGRTGQRLPSFSPEGSEWDTFLAAHETLAARKQVRSRPPPRPSLGLPDFVSRFTIQSTELIEHPAVGFAYLRQAGHVHFLPLDDGWLVLDAKLIRSILSTPQIFSSSINVSQNPELMAADPPVHGEVRSLFQPFFTPSALDALADFTGAAITRLAASLSDRSSFDFVTEFALPLTSTVSGKLLGLSAEDSLALFNRLPKPIYGFHYFREIKLFFEEYFPRHQPSVPPVMLDRIAESVGAGQFTSQNAVNLAKLMWESGVMTSSMMMTHAANYLLKHPEMARQLRAEPALIDAFLEEILRLEPPLNTIHRVTTQAVTLEGHALPSGAKVMCCVTAGNRDPAVYARPDEVDLRREPTRHLTFSGGIHACLGAYLARLEVRLVIQWMLERGPALRLAEPFVAPRYFPVENMHALSALPLRLSGTASS